jgi:hypothetical protein
MEAAEPVSRTISQEIQDEEFERSEAEAVRALSLKEEPKSRLLVILLVGSSLRISEYSRSTRRRIKPSGRDFLFSRANQSKLVLVTRVRISLNDHDY